MNSLILRTVTGVVFVALVIGSVFLNPFLFASVIGLFTLLGALEYKKLLQSRLKGVSTLVFTASALFVYLITSAVGLSLLPQKFLALNILPFFLIMIQTLFRKTDKPLEEIGAIFVGLMYIPVPMAILNWIIDYHPVDGSYKTGLILGFFVILWMNDVFAYLVGSLIGKHKLFVRISPKKTWEGSIGGALFAVLFSWLFAWLYNDLSFLSWSLMAIVIVLTGSLGDLVESMLKRSIGVKDSGKLLPGHGGVLDRFDAALMAAPFVYVYLLFF